MASDKISELESEESVGHGEGGGGGANDISKLREILRRQRQESDEEETSEIDFVYSDSDSLASELAELFSYTEHPELIHTHRAFETTMKTFKLNTRWMEMSESERASAVMLLLNLSESQKAEERRQAIGGILYIAQGCWLETQSDWECLESVERNALFLYHQGVFSAFTELLARETENEGAARRARESVTISLADSTELRIILGVLYIITEVISRLDQEDDLRRMFVDELSNEGNDENDETFEDELLSVRLLNMVTRFCSGTNPHFPMKKVLLLLWKVLLVSLGGTDTLKKIKNANRKWVGLPEVAEDTVTISRLMRAASPPASATDLDNNNAFPLRRANRPGMKRSMMTKQSSLDDDGIEMETGSEMEEFEDASEVTSDESGFGRDSPRPGSPMPPPVQDTSRSLPWRPKVRERDIDSFLEYARLKFIGFTLPNNDRTTLAGLPQPIHECVSVLNKHLYRSLADVQVEREEEIARYPLTKGEGLVPDTPTELLYASMLPSLPQYMIALLKILLAAAPTSKAKTDSVNIMTDVLPKDMPTTVMQSMKLGIEVNRHKEIIVKAVSAILLLLLKHLKVNHVYQFEFMSQHLVFANCIPLVLKFFNQNILAYISSKNNIPLLDFPSCVIGEQPDLSAEMLEIGDTSVYCWRNMFSCINLLRIFNKLTKWKHSRIMMLVVFKSAPILKRTLRVKHAMLQLYVLKLLKMQTKYLGRQWRKSNMKTLSAIYTKVRHRIHDDWAFGNDIESRPWDFQAEECALRASVDRFNQRRYNNTKTIASMNKSSSDNNKDDNGSNRHELSEWMETGDYSVASALSVEIELSEEFKRNYERWLLKDVLNRDNDFECLIDKRQI